MIAVVAVLMAAQPAAKLDTEKIEQLTGLKGKLDEKEGAFKVSYPRNDIGSTAAGVKLTPPLGLTAWAAFSGGGAHTMVMGDVVLTEDQVNPAMSAALDNGLEVTAKCRRRRSIPRKGRSIRPGSTRPLARRASSRTASTRRPGAGRRKSMG